jgi:hypothetical protein
MVFPVKWGCDGSLLEQAALRQQLATIWRHFDQVPTEADGRAIAQLGAGLRLLSYRGRGSDIELSRVIVGAIRVQTNVVHRPNPPAVVFALVVGTNGPWKLAMVDKPNAISRCFETATAGHVNNLLSGFIKPKRLLLHWLGHR